MLRADILLMVSGYFKTVRLFLLFKIAYLTWYLPLVMTTAIFPILFLYVSCFA